MNPEAPETPAYKSLSKVFALSPDNKLPVLYSPCTRLGRASARPARLSEHCKEEPGQQGGVPHIHTGLLQPSCWPRLNRPCCSTALPGLRSTGRYGKGLRKAQGNLHRFLKYWKSSFGKSVVWETEEHSGLQKSDSHKQLSLGTNPT